MTIQETIIDALKTVQTAHSSALSTIAGLRSDKAALEAEIVRLNAQIANLKAHMAHLEAEAVKIVEPDSVRSLLASLAHVVAEGQTTSTPQYPARNLPRSDEMQTNPIASTRPGPYILPRNDLLRDRDLPPASTPESVEDVA